MWVLLINVYVRTLALAWAIAPSPVLPPLHFLHGIDQGAPTLLPPGKILNEHNDNRQSFWTTTNKAHSKEHTTIRPLSEKRMTVDYAAAS
jgi:hypothetical protein